MTVARLVVVLVLAIAGVSASAAEDWELITTQGKVRVVWFAQAEKADRRDYDRIIAKVCTPDDLCIVNFWSDKKRAPRTLPMRDEEADAKVSYYIRNPFTHYEKFLWNCRLRNDPANCFR